MLRESVYKRTLELVGEQYVFEDKAREVVERLWKRREQYAILKTDREFANALTADMYEVTKDVHLRLEVRQKKSYDGVELPPVAIPHLLEHGVAHVELTRFPSTNGKNGERAIQEIDRAFLLVERARALILDVRKNPGGDGSSVALATSYILPPTPQLLALYHYRAGMAPLESWTWEKLPHEINGPYRPLADKPVCVLTSTETFSAAEEFAYNLLQMKRAVVIGEQTRGGAHPSRRHVIDGSFVLLLPVAETINPITKSNWEGVGVMPDIRCSKRDALKIAKKHVLQQIQVPAHIPFRKRRVRHV